MTIGRLTAKAELFLAKSEQLSDADETQEADLSREIDLVVKEVDQLQQERTAKFHALSNDSSWRKLLPSATTLSLCVAPLAALALFGPKIALVVATGAAIVLTVRRFFSSGASPEAIDNEYQQQVQPLAYPDYIFAQGRPFCRYDNIIAYGDNRVRLKLNDENNPFDFINASNTLGGAVATQGPRESERLAFWKMVSQTHAEAIFMLTNLTEKGISKCDLYFPTKPESPITVDGLIITFNSEEVVYEPNLPTQERIVKRYFMLHEQGSAPRIITHYHIENWPDHGQVSEKTVAIAVELSLMYQRIVAHCSAGSGRTGTFLAVREVSKNIALGEAPAIAATAKLLRHPLMGRPSMIFTEGQYQLVYKAVRQLHPEVII